jgi:hypothetical protein
MVFLALDEFGYERGRLVNLAIIHMVLILCNDTLGLVCLSAWLIPILTGMADGMDESTVP